jgi:DNA-binding beta-propeller fold protein YncE
MYLAHLTGPDGDSAITVLDTRAQQSVASIAVNDRLFGGVRLSPDGRRLYALLWPQTLDGFAPAYIAYVDTATNTVIDRFELPGLYQPQAPALSPDGRYLYFAARSGETGPYALRIADLQAKTIAVLPDPPAGTGLQAVALSPDGALLCSAGGGTLACYDTRSQTYVGRVAVQLLSNSIRPLFHPKGNRVYLLGRSTVDGAVRVYISVVNTATLTEVTRILLDIPGLNDFRELNVLSIDPGGEHLLVDEGFSGTLNVIDTRSNRVVRTVEGLTTGGLGGAVISQ